MKLDISLFLLLIASACASFITASVFPQSGFESVLQTEAKTLITGIVKDIDGAAVIGATVRVKGVDGGTITGIDGRFSIQVSDPNAVLIISFVGMEDKEIALNGANDVNAVLEAGAEVIDELVVVGYGEQKRQSVVAAISSISSREIVSTPTSNIVSGLAGKMPGLTIMLKDGELGNENIETLIRGQATVNDAAPLVLVDGVERPLSDIDPYDVETVSILKDASATAVFGVRGANGVIMLTTKKGIESKAKVTANLNYSLQNTTRRLEPLGAIDYMTTRNKVIALHNERMNQNTPLPYSDEVFKRYAKNILPEYYVDRHFQDEFVRRNVPMLKGNINIRGGNERTKYFASIGYISQGGPFKTERWDEYNYDNEERLDRFTYRANIDMQITPSLKTWLNLSGSLQDKNDPMIYLNNTTSYYYMLMAVLIDVPSVSYPDLTPEGEVVSFPGGGRTAYGMLNRSGYRKASKNNINTTIGLQQKLDKITKSLSVKAIISYDANISHARGFGRTYQTYNQNLVETPDGPKVEYIVDAGSKDSELTKVLNQSFTDRFDLEISTNYKRQFKGRHDVTAMVLYKQNQRVVNVAVPFNYVGLVGRATYGYNNKYLAEFNFGMNGSEQFAEGKRFGFFPSASAGWVLSEEKIIKQLSAINFLKVRASFGQVGNDKISGSRFLYLDEWMQGNGKGTWLHNLTKSPGMAQYVYEKTMPNPDVTWEVANKYNFGVESRFFNALEVDLDLFYEKRTSILVDASPIPELMFGQRNLPPTNTGIMSNRGFETSLSYSRNFAEDLYLGARLSMSFARNTVENMNETPTDDTYAYPYKVEGFSQGVKWGYDCLGYFKKDALHLTCP